ncbi:MAG: DNA-binding protein [Clostridia bacterium]|nr:DNA-binding protein [Clostridia bacterium]
MQDRFELNLLFDYYGAFLTDTQRDILRLSCDEDLSLSEIAEQRGISRQGVRDALTRAEKTLTEFEQRLGLIKRDRCAIELIAAVRTEAEVLLDKTKPENTPLFSKLNYLSELMEGNDGV